MKKETYLKLEDLRDIVLMKIEKVEVILTDIYDDYCQTEGQTTSSIYGILKNYLQGNLKPSEKEQERQVCNWAFDYPSIRLKIDILFDYILETKKLLEQRPEDQGEEAAHETA